MPILEKKVDHSTIQRNLLAGGWGTVLGLLFGVPPAVAATEMGLPWLPYGVGVITAGLIVGLLISFTVDALIPHSRILPDAPATPRINAAPGKSPASTIRRRLAEEKASLDRVDAQRQRRAGSNYDKTTEDRIVWGELLDLELQDIDEQVNRVRSQVSNDDDSH